MKKINYIIGLIAVNIVVVFSGCDNWLGIQPADRVTEEQVFTTESGFWGALNGVYTDMLNTNLYGAALSCELVEILGQRYNVTTIRPDYKELTEYKYTNDYPKQRLQSVWENAYRLILNCNLILKNAEEHREVLDEQAYAIVKAEALAIRAFLHFDMLRLFGPIYDKEHQEQAAIPYNEKVSVSASELLPARVVLEERVLRDLKEAEGLLKKYDPIITEGSLMSSEDEEENTYRYRGLRLNYYAILALQARVNLYADHKTEALTYAKLVIEDANREAYFPFVEHNSIMNAQNPDRVFSTEVLFSLMNNKRNDLFTNYFDPENAQTYKLVPREGTIEAMFQEDGADYRYKPLWITSPVAGESKLLINVRFKKLSNTDLLADKLMPLVRLSEMYLIAAECEPREEDGYHWLNTLRRNRGNATEVSDKLQERLKNEYAKEFLCEGQLFFYYKRTAQPSIISGVTGKKVTMNAGTYVPPLPESEDKYRN